MGRFVSMVLATLLLALGAVGCARSSTLGDAGHGADGGALEAGAPDAQPEDGGLLRCAVWEDCTNRRHSCLDGVCRYACASGRAACYGAEPAVGTCCNSRQYCEESSRTCVY